MAGGLTEKCCAASGASSVVDGAARRGDGSATIGVGCGGCGKDGQHSRTRWVKARKRLELESTIGAGGARRSTRRKEPTVHSSNPKWITSRVRGGGGGGAAELGAAAPEKELDGATHVPLETAPAVAAATARSNPITPAAPSMSNTTTLRGSSSETNSVSVRKAATATGEYGGGAGGASPAGEGGVRLAVLVGSRGKTGA